MLCRQWHSAGCQASHSLTPPQLMPRTRLTHCRREASVVSEWEVIDIILIWCVMFCSHLRKFDCLGSSRATATMGVLDLAANQQLTITQQQNHATSNRQRRGRIYGSAGGWDKVRTVVWMIRWNYHNMFSPSLDFDLPANIKQYSNEALLDEENLKCKFIYFISYYYIVAS